MFHGLIGIDNIEKNMIRWSQAKGKTKLKIQMVKPVWVRMRILKAPISTIEITYHIPVQSGDLPGFRNLDLLAWFWRFQAQKPKYMIWNTILINGNQNPCFREISAFEYLKSLPSDSSSSYARLLFCILSKLLGLTDFRTLPCESSCRDFLFPAHSCFELVALLLELEDLSSFLLKNPLELVALLLELEDLPSSFLLKNPFELVALLLKVEDLSSSFLLKNPIWPPFRAVQKISLKFNNFQTTVTDKGKQDIII